MALSNIKPLEDSESENENMMNTSNLSSRKKKMRNSLTWKTKKRLFDLYLLNLKSNQDLEINIDDDPDFVKELWKHFKNLPTRYLQDVNLEGKGILEHKELLDQVRADPESVAFNVRTINIKMPFINPEESDSHQDNLLSKSPMITGQSCFSSLKSVASFGSLANIPQLHIHQPTTNRLTRNASFDSNMSSDDDMMNTDSIQYRDVILYEITAVAKDQPELLSKFSKSVSDSELNIREAHAFNTHDKFSIDIFIVDGRNFENEHELKQTLKDKFVQIMNGSSSHSSILSNLEDESPLSNCLSKDFKNLYSEDWEIDTENLKAIRKVNSGTFGDLYLGTYYGQNVAIKVIKDIEKNTFHQEEFAKEVTIMRKVRHKNIVQFIGSGTSPPNLMLVFEFMEGGSIQDYIRNNSPLDLLVILNLALGVASGMDYLHGRNIIHRDLKSANVLLDKNKEAKICDFGVARILETNDCGTAETGTYRWMAPEVIEHKKYSNKVDVYSFGIFLWELISGRIPYAGMPPLQAAIAVVQKNLRPIIPEDCPAPLAQLMKVCWDRNPENRPSFSEIISMLSVFTETEKDRVNNNSNSNRNLRCDKNPRIGPSSSSGKGLLSRLRR